MVVGAGVVSGDVSAGWSVEGGAEDGEEGDAEEGDAEEGDGSLRSRVSSDDEHDEINAVMITTTAGPRCRITRS